MSIACPKCGSRNLRFSRTRSFSEKTRKLLGIRPMRCRDCHTRFVDRSWRFSNLAYARCPKCWRMDLNRWSDKHFQAPNYMLLALKLGANPYRCEYCRYNFVSFRSRKERFSFHRWEKAQQAAAPAVSEVPPPAPAIDSLPDPPAVNPVAQTAPPPHRLTQAAPATAAEAIEWRRAAERKRRDSN